MAPVDSARMVAYDAWTMAQINAADAPARLRKGAYGCTSACPHNCWLTRPTGTTARAVGPGATGG